MKRLNLNFSFLIKYLFVLLIPILLLFSIFLIPIFFIVELFINVKRKDLFKFINERYNLIFIYNLIKNYKNKFLNNSFPFIISIATSAGEISTIETLFEEKMVNLIIFTTSITGKNKNPILNRTTIFYLPLPVLFYSLIIAYWTKPDFFIFIEHEFWPSYFLAAKFLNVPIVTMQIRPGLFKKPVNAFFYSKLIGLSDQIYLTEDKNLYPINFPFNKVFSYNIDLKTTKKFTGYNQNKKNSIVFASTHEKEEEIFIETLKIINKNAYNQSIFKYTDDNNNEKQFFSNLFIFVVPRHPDRSRKILQNFETKGLKSLLYSESEEKIKYIFQSLNTLENLEINNNINQFYPIIIVDKFGVLDLIYRYSKVAIVGGTFFDYGGGHNIYEPLLNCCHVIAGPHLYNMLGIFNEAIKLNIASFSEVDPLKLSIKIKEFWQESNILENKKGTIEFNGSPFEKLYLTQRNIKQHILDEILKFSHNS